MLETILTTELNYFSVMSYSLFLTTVSLLFFHMTELKTIEINKKSAAVIASIIILLSALYIAIALFQYYQRINKEIIDRSDTEEIKYEKTYWYIYLTFGVILMIVQFFVCFNIVKKSFKVIR
jgi:uncharacterized membrane protein YidH (DUF202 family)